MPAELDKWIQEIKRSLRKSHPDWDEKKVNSVAWATAISRWKSKYGKAPTI